MESEQGESVKEDTATTSSDSALATSTEPTTTNTSSNMSSSHDRRQGAVDSLSESLAGAHLDDAKSDSSGDREQPPRPKFSPDRSPNASASSPAPSVTSSSGGSGSSGHKSGHATAALGPVMKKQLAYKQQTFHGRPQKTIQESKLGHKTIVEANFFQIHLPGDVMVHQYDIQYAKRGKQGDMEMKKREETLMVFWEAVRQYPNVFPQLHDFVYNGVNILWSLSQLKLAYNRGEMKIQVRMSDRLTVTMLIKYATPLKMYAKPKTVQDQMTVITVLDEVFAARIRCKMNPESKYYVQHGRSTFYVPDRQQQWDTRLAIPIGEGLEAWTGLHGAVKPTCQLGMLLNVDLGHSVFHRQNYHLVQFFAEVLSRAPFEEKSAQEMNTLIQGSVDNRGLAMRYRKMLESALKGMSLVYRQPGGNRERPFKFTYIGDKACSAHLIQMDGRQISIAEYYYTAYGYRMNFPYLPCVMLNKMKKSWVPMELCYTENEPKRLRGKIPDGALRKMVQRTAFPPLERKNLILQLAASSGVDVNKPVFLAEQDVHMKGFGVSVKREFIQARATLLPEPTLEFGTGTPGGIDTVKMNHEGEWSLNANGTLKKIRGKKKAIIPCLVFMGSQPKPDVSPLRTLMLVLHDFGLDVPMGDQAWGVMKFDWQNENWDSLVDSMRMFKGKVAEQFPGAIPMAIFILPQKCTTVRQNLKGYFSEYAMIKYICDVVVGVHAQCILQKTFGQCQGNPISCTTAHNVAIKMLGKMGIPLYNLQREGHHKNWTRLTDRDEPTLLMGIDVTHPGMLDRKSGGHAALSVACVVGNIDLDCSQFETSVRAQCVGEERTVSLMEEMSKRITSFTEKTGKRPAHVVIYRDGVSETQFAEVLYEEKEAFKEACKKLDATYKPTLTYICLTKRHHTRFFPLKPEDCHGRANNLKPGTLVECDVTSTEYFDFYLLSQHGPLGTSRPGHYYVLWDEWQPSFAFWQTITHALAYNYVRCPKSISQPAPVMYAHLAAKRAKDYLMAHYEVNGQRLSKMSDYEKFVDMRKFLHKHPQLSGMVFV